MKIIAVIVVATLAVANAAVTIRGAQEPAQAPAIRVAVGANDILAQPTALLNKNGLVMDNNAAVLKSNILKTQNDKIMLDTEALEYGDDDDDDDDRRLAEADGSGEYYHRRRYPEADGSGEYYYRRRYYPEDGSGESYHRKRYPEAETDGEDYGYYGHNWRHRGW